MHDVTIRAFDPAGDTETLSGIWLDASLLAHPFIGRARLLEQRRLIEEKYLPAAETWVACRSGEPAGFIALMENFIGGLFVAPAHQGQGIGARLIAHAFTCRDELTLEVYTENAGALRFYLAQGFEEVSRRPRDDEGFPFENARPRRRVR
ncbi:GNAT family N-acetyltransferase [Afifella marina]|uniref:GNAT family N-acetyltransferase n=1 Tax=Afifella marina TaxID=1080 RepID=UPI000DAC51CB|nr:GNAT family N-acetyltransferase [Afifella marina]RAI19975.1 GNAT family N-acetyltransferase [Afifella marina DSM 2698]